MCASGENTQSASPGASGSEAEASLCSTALAPADWMLSQRKHIRFFQTTHFKLYYCKFCIFLLKYSPNENSNFVTITSFS